MRDISSLVGKHIAPLDVSWSGSPVNIVVAMSTHCPFCVSSVPFYRSLAESARVSRASLVFVSPESLDVTSKFLEEQQITAAAVLNVPLQKLDISGTPTLFVVDGKGVIRRAFSGKLDGLREAAVLQLVKEPGDLH